MKEHGTGSIFTHLTKSTMEAQKVVLPKQDILVEYDKIASSFHEYILSLKDENQTLTSLRDTLLPKLISGEIRVKDAARSVAEVL
jgi:type I restriction enzyme S subunit